MVLTTAVKSAVSILVAGTMLVAGAQSVQAAPRDLQQVRLQVQDLQAQAESATERFNEAQGRLKGIEGDLAGLEGKVALQKRKLGEISGAVDDLARATYTSGGIDTSLQVLLADDPGQFLAQAAALDQVAHAQSASLRQTQTARLRLAQAEAELKQRQDVAQGVRNEMKAAKQEADGRLADAERVLAGLESSERARIAELAAAERKAALATAASTSQQLNQSSQSRPSRPSGPSGPSAGGGGYSGGGRAAAAVRYALAQVGDRYVAAATGPSSFDCSGLTMSAWRQAGISLPHYSYSQYRATRRIPLSQAQPGDLVFYFGGSVHHVGMYIGNGKMVHAANPGDGVIISDVLGPWYNRYFTGVGRLAG
ncbi:MAG: hypothetical protein F2793_00215 [Actinobacteria bacterium]|uniref:Unannotated protein n=1 Tax=freshwater metagenome TaxID=449393 RepID=A0A6J7CNG8_9ZZZZ|nr:hypothetical protein [Actinomycetota bacterium]